MTAPTIRALPKRTVPELAPEGVVPLTSTTPTTETRMPMSRPGGTGSFKNALARTAAATSSPAEMRAVLAAVVKTSARVCSP
jgi:hypothetical protein